MNGLTKFAPAFAAKSACSGVKINVQFILIPTFLKALIALIPSASLVHLFSMQGFRVFSRNTYYLHYIYPTSLIPLLNPFKDLCR